jgi:cytidylate kinase
MLNVPASLAAVRSAVRVSVIESEEQKKAASKPAAPPVITISRQIGINAARVGQKVVTLLNQRDPREQPWIEYDRTLVEQVAQDHDLSERLVARLSERDRSWFEHFTAGLAMRSTGSDIAVKTAQTIRGLAKVGRCIIVGRGGQCILANVPNVLHVRLVAPVQWRIEQLAERAGISREHAEKTVAEGGRERIRFIRTRFNRDVADPEMYHAILNLGRMSHDVAAGTIADMVASVLD